MDQITIVEAVHIEMPSLREQTLLVKLQYKNAESSSAALRAYRCMHGVRDGKVPMVCFVLSKMMRKFETIGILVSRLRSDRPLVLAKQSNRRCYPCRRFLQT